MKRIGIPLIVLLALIWAGLAQAKVDLVTLPGRDQVQITIYNSADMTLVRESRKLTLKKGPNRLQLSWADTLIDPTSLELLPKAQADKIRVLDLTYPPRAKNLGLWNIDSEVSGQVPVEITYLTSGLTWRATYHGTLAPDEKTMHLQGFVAVTNQSGEDYENAQTRLIVGQVRLLDRVADLARRQYPFGSPVPPPPPAMPAPKAGAFDEDDDRLRLESTGEGRAMAKKIMSAMPDRPKEIVKEGLSEYFLYTIEGTEDIQHGWTKRLPSMEAAQIPVINLYKFDERMFGQSVVRFLSFKNDTAHKLGTTPLPGGDLAVYRNVDQAGHLTFEGQSEFKYIPVEQDVELNLGSVANVLVEPRLMDYKTDQFLFDEKGNISGWDELREFQLTVKNTRDVPVKVEIKRYLGSSHWDLVPKGDVGQFEKVDLETVKFTMTLAPKSKKEFGYILTTHQGRRAE